LRVLAAGVIQDVDHVIGRRFVPKQVLAGSWNLLVRACRACNAEKATLEADISAVTLHQLAFGAATADDLGNDPAALLAEVRRKGTARSPITGRFVRESETSNTVDGRLGPASLSFTLCGPPQIDPDRVLRLASMHVRGLASLIFMRDETGGPDYLPATFVLCAEAGRGDWGAERMKGFMEKVRTWPGRLQLDGAAGGYFRAMIRKEPGPRPIWAWALEWNRQHRMMGFMGDEEAALVGLCDALPEHKWSGAQAYHDPERGRGVQRWRMEVPLSPEVDDLFSPSWSETPLHDSSLAV
jgi:hypothetical protein